MTQTFGYRSKLNMPETLPLIQVHEKKLARLKLNQFSELGVGISKENLTILDMVYQSCQNTGKLSLNNTNHYSCDQNTIL